MIILGIDPGSLVAGYGIVRLKNQEIFYEEHGAWKLRGELPDRLCQLSQYLQDLFAKYNPAATVIEKVFLGRNVDSAFKLGHARGVCLMEAAKNGSKVVEYPPRTVKKGVTGSGAASKEQVGLVVNACLGLAAVSTMDATDAVAMAYYHAMCFSVESRLASRGISL